MRLTLLGRSYCHLCDDMQVAIENFARQHGLKLDLAVVDLDLHPALEDQFGELIPLLFRGDELSGDSICHHFFDDVAVGRVLLGH
jgi:Glutaredoxin-like domain (DUF836)